MSQTELNFSMCKSANFDPNNTKKYLNNVKFTKKGWVATKICESDQNVEFRLKMRKMIKIWKLDRNMEFCGVFRVYKLNTIFGLVQQSGEWLFPEAVRADLI